MEPIQRRRLPVKVTGTLLAVVLSVVVYVTMYDTGGRPEGFRGIPWGGDATNVSGLSLLAEDGDLRFYVRPDDRMKLGDVPLEKLIYGFHKDRFYSVMMYYQSLDNFSRSKEILSRQYGAAHEPNPSEKKCVWDDENLTVLMTFDDKSSTGRISYVFKPIEKELGEAETLRSQ